ncbi:NYN domain-containing protein [bacterium]|nr:NYN domain-containing protein [bacterium]
MRIIHKNQRVGVFLDIQNLYHSAKNLYSKRVNFKNLLLAAVSNRLLIRALAYTARADEPGEESFFEALERAGIEIRIKELQVYPDGTKKGDWDVGLAVDVINLAPSLDVIVLISGDGDFLPLVNYLRATGKKVEVMAFGRTTSTKLKEAADEFIDLDDKPDFYLLKGEISRVISRIPKIIRIKKKK